MSTMTLEQIQALANQAAETSDDMNIAESGGGGKQFPDGYCLARLVQYIEFGSHAQEYQGQVKAAAPEFQLAFALYGPGYGNDDGTPYIFKPYRMSLSRNEKAGAFLTFKAMNWKGTAKHFAQLVGDAFMVKFETKASKDPAKKPRSVMNLKATLPPMDQLTKQPYNVPAPRPEDLKLFLWDYPDLTTWHSFYVEGNFDDGKSKNVIQNAMLSAEDFHGSPLQLLLATNNVAYTIPPKAQKAAGAAVAQPMAQPMAMPVAQPVAAPVQPQVALPNVTTPATPAATATPSAPVVVATQAPVMASAATAVSAPAVANPPFDPSPNGQPEQVVAPTVPPSVVAPAAVAVPNVAMPALPTLPQVG